MSAVEVLAGVDIVALRLSEEGALQVLLLRRQREPYAGQWALPGVLVNGRCVDASLDAAAARELPLTPVSLDEAGFRFALNEDAMATEKLAEGIRLFAADLDKLEGLLLPRLAFFRE